MSMNPFGDYTADKTMVWLKGGTVTPSDTNYIRTGTSVQGKAVRGLWVGGAGNVAVVFPDGEVVTFVGVQAGSLLPVAAVRVNSTNTTATSICWGA